MREYPCPIWQCGGHMIQREPKNGDEDSWQIPELVCDNCHSVYSCTQFEGKQSSESGSH